jgi:hypothetical protein
MSAIGGKADIGRSPHWVKVENPKNASVEMRGGGGLAKKETKSTKLLALCNPALAAQKKLDNELPLGRRLRS